MTGARFHSLRFLLADVMFRRRKSRGFSSSIELLESRDLLTEVRVIYLIPQDKTFNPDYALGIETAIRSLQEWYWEEMGQEKTFQLHSPIVESYTTSHDASYYGADAANSLSFHNRALADGFVLTGGSHFDPDNIWLFYLDADPSAGQLGGAGGSGIAVVPANDLRGLVGERNIPVNPGESPDPFGFPRWVGGLGHELGHALGLPHPTGCEDGDPSTPCPGNDALMWTGYAFYPDGHLLDSDKELLEDSPFLRDDVTPLPHINQRPVFTSGDDVEVSSLDGAAQFFGWARNVVSGAFEEPQSLEFHLDPDNDALFAVPPQISPNGTLTFTPAFGAEGTTTVTVTLTDDGGTADGGHDTSTVHSFVITINSDGVAVNLTHMKGAPAAKLLQGKGTLSLAILSSAVVSAAEIDLSTLAVSDPAASEGGTSFLVNGVLKDVNRDGQKDVVIKLKAKSMRQTGILTPTTTQLVIRGSLNDGTSLVATFNLTQLGSKQAVRHRPSRR